MFTIRYSTVDSLGRWEGATKTDTPHAVMDSLLDQGLTIDAVEFNGR